MWNIRSIASAASSAASIAFSSSLIQVAPLDDLDRRRPVAEQPPDRRARQRVGLVLEVVDQHEVRIHVLEPVELAQRREQLDRLGGKDPGELAASLGRFHDVVDHERLGHGLDAVDDVVEPDRQLVDVLAVEGRDEGILEPLVDLAVDPVAGLLEPLDLDDVLVDVLVGRHHLVEARRRRMQVLAVRDEQLEEAHVLGEQAERHRCLLTQPKPMVCRMNHDSAATVPAAGMVMTQASRIRRATPQRTPLGPRAEPTPMMALEMTCVVETGIPS